MLQFTKTSLTYLRHRFGHSFKPVDDQSGEENVQGKIVVVTGANGGLGKTITLQLAKRNAVVVMACRDLAKGRNVMAEIVKIQPQAQLFLIKLDLENLDSVRQCAREIIDKFPHINLLINNAGYMGTTTFVERTKEGLEKNFVINYLGHFLFTVLLLNHLKKGEPSRIVCVASMACKLATLHDPTDLNLEMDPSLGFLNLRPYNNSKLCIMLFVKELARRLAASKIRSYSLCPGFVDTGLFDHLPWFIRYPIFGAIGLAGCTPEQGAETVLHCALSVDCGKDSGKPYHFRRHWTDVEDILDAEAARKVWTASEKFVGLRTKYLYNHFS